MLKAITQFIANKAVLIVGTTLLSGHRPLDAPDNCSVVLETGGGETYFSLTDRVDKHIQILTRGTTYFTARDAAWVIYKALITNFTYGSANWDLPVVIAGTKYTAMVIEAVSDPTYIGQDEKGRYEFSHNYVFKIKNTDL